MDLSNLRPYTYLALLSLVASAVAKQICYYCAYNDHITQKRGIECVDAPRNASPNWAVRCHFRCFYETNVDKDKKQLLTIVRGCGEYDGPVGCEMFGPREVCRYNCDSDLCNGGLMGLLVETEDTGAAVSVIKHCTSLIQYLLPALALIIIIGR